MLTAIPRCGTRLHPNAEQIVAACRDRGEYVQGPQIALFEDTFARRLGAAHAISTSNGRTAFLLILRSLGFPAGSEIIVPALTFWGIPEMVRTAGLKVRFVDVNPDTGCLDPAAFERAVTPKTRAVVPTHLYGLPCDMDTILDIAERHHLAVIEDCAHALGATYRGRLVGTFGDGAIFSFQPYGPLNTSGGGMAVVRDDEIADRVRAQVEAFAWPDAKRVAHRMLLDRTVAMLTRPGVFAATGFPVLLAARLVNWHPEMFGREPVRALNPLPPTYVERYSNVQAAIGLASLDFLNAWTAATRSHAHSVNAALANLPDVRLPVEPPDRIHVYSQYCVSVPRRGDVVRRCLTKGVDVEGLRADVCPRLSLFFAEQQEAAGAERAAETVQIPIHATLSDRHLRHVTKVVRSVLSGRSSSSKSAPPPDQPSSPVRPS